VTESRLTITTSPANLLYVRLDVFRHVKMNNSTYVGLVETHAKRYRGDDDTQLAGHEVLLDVLPCNARQPGVVALSTPHGACLGLSSTLDLAFGFKQYTTFAE